MRWLERRLPLRIGKTLENFENLEGRNETPEKRGEEINDAGNV